MGRARRYSRTQLACARKIARALLRPCPAQTLACAAVTGQDHGSIFRCAHLQLDVPYVGPTIQPSALRCGAPCCGAERQAQRVCCQSSPCYRAGAATMLSAARVPSGSSRMQSTFLACISHGRKKTVSYITRGPYVTCSEQNEDHQIPLRHYAIKVIAAKSVTEEKWAISTGKLPASRSKLQTKFIRTVQDCKSGLRE